MQKIPRAAWAAPAEIEIYRQAAGRRWAARAWERLTGLGWAVRPTEEACRWHLGWALQLPPFLVRRRDDDETHHLSAARFQDDRQMIIRQCKIRPRKCRLPSKRSIPYHMIIAGDPSCMHACMQPQPIARWCSAVGFVPTHATAHIIFDRRLRQRRWRSFCRPCAALHPSITLCTITGASTYYVQFRLRQ